MPLLLPLIHEPTGRHHQVSPGEPSGPSLGGVGSPVSCGCHICGSASHEVTTTGSGHARRLLWLLRHCLAIRSAKDGGAPGLLLLGLKYLRLMKCPRCAIRRSTSWTSTRAGGRVAAPRGGQRLRRLHAGWAGSKSPVTVFIFLLLVVLRLHRPAEALRMKGMRPLRATTTVRKMRPCRILGAT